MATRVANLACTNNSDTNFRAWINEIHNALIAFGWVQTADSGQINFSTVTRPTAIGIYQGFAVYHMNDSAQSTCAVFMRLDFGTSGNSADTPGLKVQICIGSTNGSGTLTGNVCSQVIAQTNTGPNSNVFNVHSAGDAGSFRMNFWTGDVGGLGWTLVIERDQDSSGNDTTTGVTLLCAFPSAGNAITTTSQFLETAGGIGTQFTAWYAWLSGQSTQSGFGGVGVGPVRPVLGQLRNPMKTVLLASGADFPTYVTTPVTVYGVSRTYMVFHPQPGMNPALNIWNTANRVLLLWQ